MEITRQEFSDSDSSDSHGSYHSLSSSTSVRLMTGQNRNVVLDDVNVLSEFGNLIFSIKRLQLRGFQHLANIIHNHYLESMGEIKRSDFGHVLHPWPGFEVRYADKFGAALNPLYYTWDVFMDELIEIRILEKENAGSEFEEEVGDVCNYNERITGRRIPICVFTKSSE